MPGLQAALISNLERCRGNDFEDNHDFRSLEASPPRSKGLLRRLLFALGYYRSGRHARGVMDNVASLDWLYDRLDDRSRDLLVQVLSYRVLGERHVRLPLNTPAYWEKLKQLDELAARGEKIGAGFHDWQLSKTPLHGEGYPVELFVRPSGVYTQLLLQQYRCDTGSQVIEAAPGDVVIDAGACYGETAVYFAHKAGASGKVFSWEFMPNNIGIFERNMALNPEHARRIELIRHPLWSRSGEKLYVSGSGPATRVAPKPPKGVANPAVVETYTIDDLRRDRGLKSVDFIKMDIEGAEFEALKGAVQTLRSDRPKLAISVYHRIQDFWQIPQWLESLNLGYRFHLRHFTIYAGETVLFAVAPRGA